MDMVDGYKTLGDVLISAYNQASKGKGKERHSSGEEFEDQLICYLERRGHTFDTGQACKKIDESLRLSPNRAIHELLGAINYIAARIIVLQDQMEEEAEVEARR